MIAQIEGKLIHLDQTSAMVQVGQIAYEVLLPGYCISALAGKIDSDIKLCTFEYYEGTPGGGNLMPRMVGFLNHAEKDFFFKYTSVKGMGIKKGLKSLSLPIPSIASAIESGDEKLLASLPGIGKRLGQHIIAELKGKLEVYASQADYASSGAPSESAGKFERFQIETLEILIAWGEKRNEAIELISMTCKKHPEIKSAEELVPLAYKMKQGAEV